MKPLKPTQNELNVALLSRFRSFINVKEIENGFEFTLRNNGASFSITSDTPIVVKQTCLPDPE